MIRKPKIIYACPFAHHAGHYPHAAVTESTALSEAGAEVLLCTFRGILAGVPPHGMRYRSVIEEGMASPVGALARLLSQRPKTRPLSLLLETLGTLTLAIRLRHSLNFDLIYLRDGDPFIFLPHLLGVFTRGHKWGVSLAGDWSAFKFLHRLVTLPLWKPIYRLALSRNRFVYFCQNRAMRMYYEGFLSGVLRGRVREAPLWTDGPSDVGVSPEEAKRLLGLPRETCLLLHFGALHSGKDFETVVHAVRDLPQVLLVHAGSLMPSFSRRIDLATLTADHVLGGRLILRDGYVSERDKRLYFRAADAVILSYRRSFLQTASVLWEAARFGTPVIASDNGDLGELVERYHIGFVFNAQDSDSLRKSIVEYLNLGPAEREALRRGCLSFCEEFSIGNWARGHLHAVASLWE